MMPAPAAATTITDAEQIFITLQDATFGYDGKAILSNVWLTVGPHEVIVVTGHNGSGKTTMTKGILGLSQHLGGSVELFGEPLARFTRHHLIGYVPQRHTVGGPLPATVREVVSSGRLVNLPWYKWPSREDYKVIDEAIDTVDLTEFRNQPVSELSGGQQRRVLIARALTTKPQVLLMDEPTAGVDVENQRLLVDSLAKLTERGVGLMIVSHELDPLLPVATRMLTVAHGELVYDGPLQGHQRTQEGAAAPRHHTGSTSRASSSPSRRAAARQVRLRRAETEHASVQPGADLGPQVPEPDPCDHQEPIYDATFGDGLGTARTISADPVAEPVRAQPAAEPAMVGTVIGAGKYRVVDAPDAAPYNPVQAAAAPVTGEYDPAYHAYATSNGYYQHPQEPEPDVVPGDVFSTPTTTQPLVADPTQPAQDVRNQATGKHAASPQHAPGHQPEQDNDFLPPPELKTTHQSLWR